MTEVREYDIGVELLVTLTDGTSAMDVSTATTIQFRFRKPDADSTEVTKTGSFKTDGSDGKVRYVSQDGDFDTVGIWRYQVRVILSGGSDLTSDDAKFRVADAIGKPE